MLPATMRYVVYGAGAIGGVVGARLAEAGHDVALIARGAHLHAMGERGLTIRSPQGSHTVELPAFANPVDAGVGEGDVVLLAVKGQHTRSALDGLDDAGATVPVVCLQNGVANEREVLRRQRDVYAVAVMCSATHLEPGVVDAWSSPTTGLLDIGRYPAGTDELAEVIAAAFGSATFESVVRPDIMRWKHAKLLMNLGNAVEALCGSDARAGELVAQAREEGRACFAAAGIDAVSVEEDRERRGDRLRMAPIDGERHLGGSTWQSFARGASDVETDLLNGEIVLLGRLHGVPTPVNAALQKVTADAVRRGDAPGSLTEADILAAIT